MRAQLRAIALSLFLMPSARPAFAAVGTVVRGTVTDEAGHALPNVQVIVTALNRATTTNAGGTFTFSALPIGTYHLSALLIGFAPAHADVTVPENGPDVLVTITMHETSLHLTGVQVTATPIGTDPRDVPQSTVDLTGQALARELR